MLSAGRLVYDLWKKHILRYVVGIAIAIVSIYCNTILPKYLGYAIDGLHSAGTDIQYVRHIAVVFGDIALISFGAMFTWRFLIFGFCRNTEFYLREKLFIHLQKLSSDFYAQNNTGDLINRAISDVNQIRLMIGIGVVRIIDLVLTLVLSAFNMSMSLTPLLTLLALAPIPFLAVLILKVRLIVRTRFAKVQEAVSDISSKVQENMTGIRVIKAFAQEEQEASAFSSLSLKKAEAEQKLARAYGVMNPAIGLTFGIVFSVFLVLGGGMVARKEITLGQYVSFNTYLLYLMGPVGSVGWLVELWQKGAASLKRLNVIFLEKPSVNDTLTDPSITVLGSGSIEAKHLEFSYGNSGTIKKISFYVPSGGSVAIMGPTGCGKSTITNLITRVWTCGDGMLFVDGKDINQIPLEILRENCVFVPQESFLFSDTIIENIRFYDKTITDEQVYEAAAAADVHDAILGFPKGYDTIVGERGMTLSGGQKQRITIARALVRKPKILLLDDCMSALDSATEQRIIKKLEKKITGCTCVIITHRLTVSALADNIIILNEDGSLAEMGTHSELMKSGGAYARMVETMQSEESILR